MRNNSGNKRSGNRSGSMQKERQTSQRGKQSKSRSMTHGSGSSRSANNK
jgi:hypothetical protein